LHGILCPSYKKGFGAVGFAPQPGNTTHRGFANLQRMVENAQVLGLKCSPPLMLLSDVAIENWERLAQKDWDDFMSIARQDAEIADSFGIRFMLSTEFDPSLLDSVGRGGKLIDLSSLPIEGGVFRKCLDRDINFYQKNFGWTREQAMRRTQIHAHSYWQEAITVRRQLANPVMVYSAYDYEKARFSNGIDGRAEPCIIYPRRKENNPSSATIDLWK